MAVEYTWRLTALPYQGPVVVTAVAHARFAMTAKSTPKARARTEGRRRRAIDVLIPFMDLGRYLRRIGRLSPLELASSGLFGHARRTTYK
jgi:FAD/FMN-containing dehydrogenase